MKISWFVQRLVFILLVFGLNSFSVNPCLAQSASNGADSLTIFIDHTKTQVEPVPSDKIEKFRNSKDFNYNRELKKGFNLMDYILYWLSKILEAIFSKQGAAPYIRLIVIVLVLAFVIYKIFGGNLSGIFSLNKKLKSENGFSYFDEDIHTQDLDEKLEKAIRDEKFKDAIRYYYLKLLKLLDSNGLIQWEISKTNFEYQKELKSNNILDSFIILSGIYEYTWYGNFSVNRQHFNNWQSDFQSAFNQIERK